MRRIIYFLLIAIFFIVPVSVASSSNSDVEYVQKSNFWTWAAGEPGTGWNKFIGYTFGVSCPNSEDGYHHASSYEAYNAWSRYYKCICDLCGAKFDAYEKDLQQSYEAQVAELPAQGISSAGKLIWRPCIDDFVGYHYNFFRSLNGGSSLPSDSTLLSLSFDIGTNSVKVVHKSDSYYCRYKSGYMYFSFRAPLDGTYGILSDYPCFFIRAVDETGSVVEQTGNFPKSSYFHFSAGSSLGFSSCYDSYDLSVTGIWSGFSYWYFPVFEIIPDSVVDITSGDTYNINSRPTSITGDYGIVGDNGQIIKVEGNKIVNETNNTIYNPATGQTTTITDWSYNYEDRSYTVTTESGDTITITYGDENVTIKEGDTIYNIYYLVDSGSGAPGPDVPGGCNHDWTETSRTDPSCSTPGKVTFTCSKCSQPKTETIPATGHAWVIDRTVQTTYDEEGNLLQQGYTIYSCSVCGEQYKDMEGIGPPGPSDGDNSGDSGLIEFLDGLIKSLSKNLHGAVELILSFFQEAPAMFGGFLDFLAAMFPFLPPEIMTLFTFGIAAVVFIGIIKAIRR